MVNDKVDSRDSVCGDTENCHKMSTCSPSDQRLICNGNSNFDAPFFVYFTETNITKF